MEISDEELILEYLAGNEDAFASLVQHHLKNVYSFVVRAVGGDAEDITQEIFLKVWKHLKKYNPKTALFKTWLMRIARNTVVDHLRKKRHFVFSDLTSDGDTNVLLNISDTEPLPDEIASRTYDALTIKKALEALAPLYREVVLLRYMSGITFEEISSILDEPMNTVKSRHHRAIAKLRQYLETLHQKDR